MYKIQNYQNNLNNMHINSIFKDYKKRIKIFYMSRNKLKKMQ